MEQLPNINNTQLNGLRVPRFDHKEPEDNDCGLPEDPVFSNYSKYLWKGHRENPRIRKNSRLPEQTDGNKNFK